MAKWPPSSHIKGSLKTFLDPDVNPDHPQNVITSSFIPLPGHLIKIHQKLMMLLPDRQTDKLCCQKTSFKFFFTEAEEWGADIFDKMPWQHSSRAVSRRWPVAVFFNIFLHACTECICPLLELHRCQNDLPCLRHLALHMRYNQSEWARSRRKDWKDGKRWPV